LVVLPVLIYRLTGSTVLTAVVAALEALPYVIFGLFAGALSDRRNRRSIMIVADLVDATLLASVPIAYSLGFLTVGHVLVVAFASPPARCWPTSAMASCSSCVTPACAP